MEQEGSGRTIGKVSKKDKESRGRAGKLRTQSQTPMLLKGRFKKRRQNGRGGK